VVVPEIEDYEVRRELLRAGKDSGLGRLDAFKALLSYAPITTPVMLKAAEFWATARTMGRHSADDASLARRRVTLPPTHMKASFGPAAPHAGRLPRLGPNGPFIQLGRVPGAEIQMR
jgi:hypothetical protein